MGAETETIKRLYYPEIQFDEDYDAMLDELMGNVEEDINDDDIPQDAGGFYLSLNSFNLVGLSIDPLINGPYSLLDFPNLTSMSLEECRHLESFFTIVQNAKNKQVPEHQQNLRNRDFGQVLLTHGKTLRTLVWEERIVCREGYFDKHSDTTFPSPSGLIEIARNCDNLVELGVPIDWRIFTSTSLSQDQMLAHMMLRSSLRSLRTLNIRNMPSFDAAAMKLPVNSVFSGFVDRALAALVRRSDVNDTMPLDTLALGALRYRDVRNGLGLMNVYKKEKYKFLRLQVYNVDRRYQFEGRNKPLAILREVGTYEKTKAAGYCVEVLKPYWLR
ncbi:MAG: hypothetical protein Q9226_001322 [Calogaya cf. arnoldii]